MAGAKEWKHERWRPMLPMPGAPSSSWRLTRARMTAAVGGMALRVTCAFWLFGTSSTARRPRTRTCSTLTRRPGLINNIFYVIILSAALDLVGPSIPKATVLLSSIIPGLATKLIVPYIIHHVPYSARVILLATLSTCGMLTVALSPSSGAGGIAAKVAGIVLANVSSGAGEVHFLAVTHFYGTRSLAAWGSGTGGAGLVGAGAYALATTTLGFGVRGTLLASAVLPLGMIISFFAVLPLDPLKTAKGKELDYESIPAGEIDDPPVDDRAGLLDPEPQLVSSAYRSRPTSTTTGLFADLRLKLLHARTLVLPYMLPLFLVYVAEYTINPKDNPDHAIRWGTEACVTPGSMHPASEAIIVGLRDLATLDDRVQGIIDAVQQLFDPRAEQEGMDDLIQQMEELKEEWLGELGEFLERRRRGMGDVVTRAGSCRWRGVDVP